MVDLPTQKRLKENALTFHIEPKNPDSGLVTLDGMVQMLASINRSYGAFLRIALTRVLGDEIKEESIPALSDLLIVEASIASYELSAAPAILSTEQISFLPNVWIGHHVRNAYANYFSSVLAIDYQSQKQVKDLMQEFSAEERRLIFGPLFQSLENDYLLRVKSSFSKNSEVIVKKPTKAIKKQLIPPTEKEKKHTAFVVAYVDDNVKGEPNKSSIRKVLVVEPYKRNHIVDGDRLIKFNHSLQMQVRREEGRFILTSDELDLTVWGDTFEAAEEAVGYTIGRLYDEYYKEEDTKLSIGAKKLKDTLRSLIKKIIE